MALPHRKNGNERPRELRRRVVIPARIRTGAQWSDACILNISSRGLMIHSHQAGPKGALVELHRGDRVITARVVWREGSRAGLESDDRLPVEEIMSLGLTKSLRLVASEGAIVDRRRRPRTPQKDARICGRLFEFAGTAAIVVILALAIGAMVQQALARPLATLEATLPSD